MTSTYQERMTMTEKVDRTVKSATTYLRKASWWLLNRSETHYVPWWYSALLDQCVATATDIVEALPEEFFETSPLTDHFGLGGAPGSYNLSDDMLKEAQALVAAIEARRGRTDVLRKVGLLENPSGRTPEEAELFRSKAMQLRERHGL